MKAPLALLGFTFLVTLQLQAGPETIVRERAKELRDQNNVRQGVPPPTQPQPGVANPGQRPAQATPALATFQTDLAAIKPDTAVTAEQKQKIAADIVLGAQGAKPSSAAAAKLAADLTAALSQKPLATDRRARLAQDLDAVLNPSKYPQAKLDGIFKDIQAIFQENELHRTKAVAIADDVKAISAEIQRGAAQ